MLKQKRCSLYSFIEDNKCTERKKCIFKCDIFCKLKVMTNQFITEKFVFKILQIPFFYLYHLNLKTKANLVLKMTVNRNVLG